ncbi:MAG: ribonuclease III [Candidatus Wildermuthbacteria bacterium RIFCSPHIGHO2_01_FULL_48_25]|uniref:Ribonuclease 3 n=1 Tax=Candidatus Wildermuthbacteria bacterium RIFCSPLOWO2_01_FULL_48_16 TaxID=1802461 RepID=A0A1G2RN01_9BACT|nr:MAG: ribonuclease III [Candidatus Wildermuthbacteria bacterium RIFCSPHIGHO2_01_FULL_48_25]OHA69418.1 MAG: ribonuclease III [Candidatus Wildermuthbacteria bacterium RIFCSPHIGHO2_02_FULL_49_12b]OHA73401.1 MAG: ribonuclease III [Candidatus Wildermuthbacteria bacterium RIFCSPLOWO2_01_FULL_48_16]
MDWEKLENSLGVSFRNKDFLTNAFVHRSYLNENPSFHLPHNERIEFLGDAVIELAVTKYLFNQYPDKPEGELTTWRAALVKATALSDLAKELGFGDYLLLSRGEAKEGGKARDEILSNTMEAFMGALYLDQGFEICEEFIGKHLLPKLEGIIKNKLFQDGKSRFQEVAQEKTGITPIYKALKEWGPDHQKQFRVGVFLEEEKAGEGEGSSKQEAEEAAAKNALKNKHWH